MIDRRSRSVTTTQTLRSASRPSVSIINKIVLGEETNPSDAPNLIIFSEQEGFSLGVISNAP